MFDFMVFDLLARFKFLDQVTDISLLLVFATLYSLGYFFTFVKLGYGRSAFALLFPIINLVIIFDFIEIRKWLIFPWVFLTYGLFIHSLEQPLIKDVLLVLFWIVNTYISVLLSLRVAQSFSKGKIFAAFLFFFGSIGYIILAFFKVPGIKKGVVGKRRNAVPGATFNG
ncbi:hypothetical protein [Candidatus Uabimicrobium sp. HlEnr_7]|uniref:hypothetical protein n=1 Tax=Candidatus Uabimicrobium helgolandensis TaxID=3095367 RepID=UPI0035582C02